VHDIGKISIPDYILNKPGRLTPEERAIVEIHPVKGSEVLEPLDFLRPAIPIVRHHHERYDGTGYLESLSGSDIPKVARIFAIADVFDALTSKRPYKAAMGYEESMKILQEGRGSHFDPEIMDSFAKIAPELYDTYANRDDKTPRDDLRRIGAPYFGPDLAEVVSRD
jgi:HD-GYP domain-containing protein (c-di-GMP phosphodiesterase class II)